MNMSMSEMFRKDFVYNSSCTEMVQEIYDIDKSTSEVDKQLRSLVEDMFVFHTQKSSKDTIIVSTIFCYKGEWYLAEIYDTWAEEPRIALQTNEHYELVIMKWYNREKEFRVIPRGYNGCETYRHYTTARMIRQGAGRLLKKEVLVFIMDQ